MKSLAIGDQHNLQLLSLPQRSGGRAESCNSLITWLVPLANSFPHTPYGLPKSYFININSGVIKRGLFWKTEDATFTLMSSRAVSGARNKAYIYIYFLLCHNFTICETHFFSPQSKALADSLVSMNTHIQRMLNFDDHLVYPFHFIDEESEAKEVKGFI